jgi:SNF2 family DNA or RNA helicase
VNIIKIDTALNDGVTSFRISGDYESIKNNSRLRAFLRRVRATLDNKAYYVPYVEELKVAVLQSIEQGFNRHNFTCEISAALKEELEHYYREMEKFNEFSSEANLIRNNHFDDNDNISEKFLEFKNLYTQILKPEYRVLYPIQELSAFHMAFSQNSCNFAVPGAGKTSIVFGAYAYLKCLPEDDPRHVDNLLVIGPLSSFQPWKEEYEECFGTSPTWFSLSGNSELTRSDKFDYLYSKNPKELTLIYHGSVDSYQTGLVNFLKRNKTMVVVDEAHRIKNPERIWGMSVTKISEMAVSRVALTGTPTPNGYQDIFNIYKFIYPYKFKEIIEFNYQDLIDMSRHPELNVSDIERLKHNLEPFFIRIKKNDLEKHMDLPKAINHPPIYVEMDSDQRSIYDFILAKYIAFFKKHKTATAKDIFNRARLIRLRQAASNPSLLLKSLDNCVENSEDSEDLDFNSKYIDETENILSDIDIVQQIEEYSKNKVPRKFTEAVSLITDEIFPRGEKVIIWTIFIQNSKELQNHLSNLNIPSKLLIGEVPLDERVSIISKFNDPKNRDFHVVIANPFSVSESISLHKGCRNAIYLERDYNCAMFLQSRDRIHRVGLTRDQKPNFYYIISNDSVDEVIDNRLKEKIALMENLINDDIPLFSRLDDDDETNIITDLLDMYDSNSFNEFKKEILNE